MPVKTYGVRCVIVDLAGEGLTAGRHCVRDNALNVGGKKIQEHHGQLPQQSQLLLTC